MGPLELGALVAWVIPFGDRGNGIGTPPARDITGVAPYRLSVSDSIMVYAGESVVFPSHLAYVSSAVTQDAILLDFCIIEPLYSIQEKEQGRVISPCPRSTPEARTTAFPIRHRRLYVCTQYTQRLGTLCTDAQTTRIVTKDSECRMRQVQTCSQ